jgi:zinc finger protein
MSFYCPHCHFKNSEIQAAGEIQERGSRQAFKLTSMDDLSRQVVKSDTCIVKFEELEVEIPAGRGQLTNVEGLLRTTLDDLEFGQAARRSLDPETYEKLETLIGKGRQMLNSQDFPFLLSLDDPAGNSSIEPSPDDIEGTLTRSEYPRTPEQNEALLLGTNDSTDVSAPTNGDSERKAVLEIPNADAEDEIVPNEVYSFPVGCPGCMKSCITHMKMVDIPHFKEVIIMSTVCQHCGCELTLALFCFQNPNRNRSKQ